MMYHWAPSPEDTNAGMTWETSGLSLTSYGLALTPLGPRQSAGFLSSDPRQP